MSEEDTKSDDALVDDLISEVMKIERKFAYEQANAHTKRKSELKAKIETLLQDDSQH